MDPLETMFSLLKIDTMAWDDGILSKSGTIQSTIELARFNQAL